MVDSRLAKVMARDDPDWRMANACSACNYRVSEEIATFFNLQLNAFLATG